MSPPSESPSHNRQNDERRAPGWEIRCPRCGLKEPYGKYGIRLWAAGRSVAHPLALPALSPLGLRDHREASGKLDLTHLRDVGVPE